MKGIILFVIVIISSSLEGQDSTYDSLFFMGSVGLRLPYRVLQPMIQESDEKYPLVIFLHGSGERGNDNVSQLIHGSSLFGNAEHRTAHPAFVIFPQCSLISYWSSVDFAHYQKTKEFRYNYNKSMSHDLRTVVELIDYYISKYPVDRRRVYLVGLSMGGMGTFELAQRFPGKFAAAIPICGGADITSFSKRSRKTAFWIFHGDADIVVPVKGSRDMEQRLKELGHDVKYTEYPDVNHNSWDSAFIEPDFLFWMFAQKR